MVRWKAPVDFLLTVVELLFLSYRWRATRQNVSKLTAFRRGGSVWAKIAGGRGRPYGIFFLVFRKLDRFWKLDTFCYLTVQIAPCYVQSFWHNTGVWHTDGQTDRQTDGRNCWAVASTALAMRALRRAVRRYISLDRWHRHIVLLLYDEYCTHLYYYRVRVSVRVSVTPHLHDTTGCQTGCTTGLTTGCIV